MKKSSKIFWIVIAAIVALIAIFSITKCAGGGKDVDYSEFKAVVNGLGYSQNGLTDEIDMTEEEWQNAKTIKDKLGSYEKATLTYVYIDDYVVEFKIHTETLDRNGRTVTNKFTFNTVFARGDTVTELEETLSRHGVQFTYKNPNSGSFWSSLIPIFGAALIMIVFLIIMSQSQGGTKSAMNFAKTNARLNHNLKVRFTDVAGAEEEKHELQEVVDFLKNPKKFSDLGARIPKGVLLVGPPGTGKTLFAKAVAGEAGVPFFSISGSDFVEMFVGVGASRVRDLFDVAKKNMPCIVFIDEIDAVGRQRGTGMGGGHDEREQTLNQLLVEMDGFETNSSVIIMAATNRADILDPALLRPGRFDRQIYVNYPDVKGREAILKVHARKKPIGPDVDFKTVARLTVGFTGADLQNLLNEAAILAVREGRNVITMVDINEGFNKVIMGPAKKSRVVTEPDKRITAYHESGHAILGMSLKHCNPVHEVTIIPRGHAGGYTMALPEKDSMYMHKEQFLDDITMTLGGRVAEELVIGKISSGASGDIRSLTATAHKMVVEYGMSEKVGPIFYGSEGEVFIGRSYQNQHSYSENVAKMIDEEVHAIVSSCYETAKKILTEKMDVMHNMARVLFERETIHSAEVQMLMEGKSAEEVIAAMDGTAVATLTENN